MTDPTPLQTALHDRHVAMEAKMADEAGWRMPLSYSGILDEARGAHEGAAVCDISHVGRFRLRGDGALDLLERLCTHDVAHQEDDTAHPTCLLNASGGILDCGFLWRLDNQWWLTGDPINRAKTREHLRTHAADFDVRVDDQTEKGALLWVAGPSAPRILDDALPRPIGALPRGRLRVGSYLVTKIIVARIGAAALWSAEALITGMLAGRAWDFLTRKVGDGGIRPVGLAARDVLRVEAGVVRYGHEVNETIDPFTAGLGGWVDLNHDFLGAEALSKAARRPPGRRRILLRVDRDEAAGRIPRQGDRLVDAAGDEAGVVTSATFSPLHDAPLAQAYVREHLVEVGRRLRLADRPGQPSARVVRVFT